MTLQHYTNTSYKLSKKLTTAYSTSFSLGIKVFTPEYRDPIFAITDSFVLLMKLLIRFIHTIKNIYSKNLQTTHGKQ